MNNIKLNEFIISYSDFWNKLSDKNKELLSDLDEYGDLSVYSLTESCINGFMVSHNSFYLYIGNKGPLTYYLRCTGVPVRNGDSVVLNISNPENNIIIMNKINSKTKYI